VCPLSTQRAKKSEIHRRNRDENNQRVSRCQCARLRGFGAGNWSRRAPIITLGARFVMAPCSIGIILQRTVYVPKARWQIREHQWSPHWCPHGTRSSSALTTRRERLAPEFSPCSPRLILGCRRRTRAEVTPRASASPFLPNLKWSVAHRRQVFDSARRIRSRQTCRPGSSMISVGVRLREISSIKQRYRAAKSRHPTL
jgi:hypothetical protein